MDIREFLTCVAMWLCSADASSAHDISGKWLDKDISPSGKEGLI